MDPLGGLGSTNSSNNSKNNKNRDNSNGMKSNKSNHSNDHQDACPFRSFLGPGVTGPSVKLRLHHPSRKGCIWRFAGAVFGLGLRI